MRLTYLLTQQDLTAKPRTYALLALFCFQTSRLPARLSDNKQIILLKHQDRSLWYRSLIEKGFQYLEQAIEQDLSVYHVEAAIAYLHAIAPSFCQTNWKAIYSLYGVLNDHWPTPFIALNKAIAGSYAIDPQRGLRALLQIKRLQDYYIYHTAMGDVQLACGRNA